MCMSVHACGGAAAPLIMGNDARNIAAGHLPILLNSEAIAVNQVGCALRSTSICLCDVVVVFLCYCV